MALEIATLSSEVEEDFLRISASSSSEETTHIYQCIDNFVDQVLSSMQNDMDNLEKAAGSLQIYHEVKNEPMNSFLKSVMGAHNEIPKIEGIVDSSMDGEMLMKYCNTIKLKTFNELSMTIHGTDVNNQQEQQEQQQESTSVEEDDVEDIFKELHDDDEYEIL